MVAINIQDHDEYIDRDCGGPMLLKAIRDALALLDAINQGELFAALPEHPSERRRHETGITLLDLLEARLRAAASNASR